jgi:hypothetical protein
MMALDCAAKGAYLLARFSQTSSGAEQTKWSKADEEFATCFNLTFLQEKARFFLTLKPEQKFRGVSNRTQVWNGIFRSIRNWVLIGILIYIDESTVSSLHNHSKPPYSIKPVFGLFTSDLGPLSWGQ